MVFWIQLFSVTLGLSNDPWHCSLNSKYHYYWIFCELFNLFESWDKWGHQYLNDFYSTWWFQNESELTFEDLYKETFDITDSAYQQGRMHCCVCRYTWNEEHKIVTLAKKEETQILKSSNCSGLFLLTQKQKVPWQFSLWQLRTILSRCAYLMLSWFKTFLPWKVWLQREHYLNPSRIIALLWWRGLRNSMKLWAMPMQGHPRQTGHSGEFWQNVVQWRREWQATPVFLWWESHEQYEKAKRYETW